MASALSRTILAAAMLAALALAPVVTLATPRGDTVAVSAGPGGVIVRMAAIPGIAIVTAGADPAGFVGRLYEAGAWFVFDPTLAGGRHAPASLARKART